MRVLFVEDEARIADFITQGLAEQAYAVDVASNGDEALQWAEASDFDLIILDVMLPRHDGVEVCLRCGTAECKTPISMLTGRDAMDDSVGDRS